MKKIVMILFVFIMVYTEVFAFDESIIEDEEGLYVETVASVGIPNINARAAILYDVTYDRVLYEKNSKQRRANASTTKMITALVAYENGNLDDIVEVSKNAAMTSGSSINLKTGDKITLGDLIKGLLIHSGNDAAVAIAEYVAGDVENFSKLMNEKAEEIGAVDTHFVTPHGLDEENHFSTAYDLMVIGREVLKNTYLSNIISQKSVEITINGNIRNLNSTNEMLSYYDGTNGIKTGYTGNAGRCLVTAAKRDGRQLISVVLGCDSKKNRTVDSVRLLDYGFYDYKVIDLGQYIKKDIYINVEKSENGIYRLKKDFQILYPLKESELDKIYIKYDIKSALVAPLREGEKIGDAIIELDGVDIKHISYTLPEKIDRKSWKDYFYRIFESSINNFYFFT